MGLCLAILLTAFRMIVIPVQFEDRDFSCTRETLQETVTKAQEYFNTQYDGASTFSFTLAPTVTLTQKMSWYGADYTDRRDVLMYQAVKDACSASRGEVDFSQYDNDGDGYVDNVMIITAGQAENDGGGEDSIWPQHDQLSQHNTTLNIDGKKVNSYTVCCESSGTGIFCHEFGHYLGLEDMYDTDGELSGGTAEGLRGISLMDEGSKRASLPGFNAIEMEILGIGKCDTLVAGSWTLKPSSAEKRYLKAPGTVKDEYFLFECRDKGLYIYHVDKSESYAGYSDYYKVELTAYERWKCNQVNCRPDHQCAMLMSADETASEEGGMCFPQSGKDSFSSETTPAFRYYDESASSLALTGISRNSNGSVTFDVVEPLAITDVTAFQDAAIVSWKVISSITAITSYVVTWTDGTDEHSMTVSGSAVSCTVNGLKPQTSYKVTVKMNTSSGGKFSADATFITKFYRSGTYPYIYLNSASRGKDNSIVAGSRIPLRVFNASDVKSVEWFFGSRRISSEADGWYTLKSSGTLKAKVTHNDGAVEYIIKEVTVK